MEIEYKRKRTLNHRAERACGYRSNLLMMDIKYDFKANPFKEKDGKPVLYPAVVVKETITTDHIVKELSKHSAYSAGCVVGVLQEVADMYNPQIQISAESGTKRSIFRQKNKTKRSKKAAHNTYKVGTKG